MKTVVVTGASGFVGRNLVNYFVDKNIHVYAIVRNPDSDIFHGNSNVSVLKYDLSEADKIEKRLRGIRIDAFYHLAWQGARGSGRSEYLLQIENTKYACDMAVVASHLSVLKFIAVGTITERLADELLENKSTAQNLMYGLTKSYTHKLLNLVCAKEKINLIWAELSNIYGGDDDSGNLISYTIDCFKNNIMPTFGPCNNYYDFIHIDDVIRILYELGQNQEACGFYFVGRCENKILKEYIEEIGRLYAKEVAIGTRPDDGVCYKKEWFDNRRLTEELKYSFKYSFEEGIKKEMERGEENVGKNRYKY